MLIGKIHPGSGIGDQLFSYITTRTIALDKGYKFGFLGIENFKGKDFMNLDWGQKPEMMHNIEQPSGKLVTVFEDLVFEFNKPYYDPEVNFIKDGTIIDGCSAQDERYWGHRLPEIREWLKVEPICQSTGKRTLKDGTIGYDFEMPDDLCVINFRGGEYATVPELFLPKEYWDKAVELVKEKNRIPTRFSSISNFEVHTDDPVLAEQFFPDFKIVQDIALNWRSIRYAKHLILSNSAFGILPALLNENVKEVIAPRYWAGRNVGEWRRPQNYYSKFTYI